MKDKSQGGEAEFLAAARAEMERGCAELDGGTRARLGRIRQQALEREGGRRLGLLAPFGGLVTACVLVLALVVLERNPAAPENIEPVPQAEDLEILSSGDLELYEDFEFYPWLAENGA